MSKGTCVVIAGGDVDQFHVSKRILPINSDGNEPRLGRSIAKFAERRAPAFCVRPRIAYQATSR